MLGTWMVECTIGEYQLSGMRAKLLVYNPSKSRIPASGNSEFKSYVQIHIYFPDLGFMGGC